MKQLSDITSRHPTVRTAVMSELTSPVLIKFLLLWLKQQFEDDEILS